MDLKSLALSINQIAEQKNIPQEKVQEVLEQAIAAAYKREYGKKAQRLEAKIDPKTGQTKFWQVLEVVDKDMLYSEEELKELEKAKEKELLEPEGQAETAERKIRFNPDKHIMVQDAKKIDQKAEVGGVIKIALESKQDFGRIATQTAKQVILQKLREAEREAVFAEYKDKEGQVVPGIVQRVEAGVAYVDLGKAIGYLPKAEQIPTEKYTPGQRLKFYLLAVEDDPRGPKILLSRAYPKLISRLFELEVPEIASGQIEIKAIAREPGSRSKIALKSLEENLDPVGSAIGQRGNRVGAVISELSGEKIDIIQYSEDSSEFIKNALSPAKVKEIKILPKNRALCLVEPEHLSLAIGKEGQNVRLASELTGWKIDVKSIESQEKESEPKHSDKSQK